MTMAATVIPRLLLCPTPGTAAYNNQLQVKYGERYVILLWENQIDNICFSTGQVCYMIVYVNGVIIIIMNIMCFDAFGALIEYMLKLLSWCSFIFDIKWNWKSIVWWWWWCSWWAVVVSTTSIEIQQISFEWVLEMDDCYCKISLISPSVVVLNATMEQVSTIFCLSKVPTIIFQESYFNSNSLRWVLWIIMNME
jgi:hypothetical protein